MAGPKEFIGRVHKMRKMLGGGMRQVGVIAAPGKLRTSDPTQLLSWQTV